MTKQQLLKRIHGLIWKDDDMVGQNSLEKLQKLINTEIVEEAKLGNLKINQLKNKFIKEITIPECEGNKRMKQVGYTIIVAYRSSMISSLKDEVREMQEENWKCQGGFFIDSRPEGESSCYQAMVKEE